jgi:sulfite reductase (ferredoxin)
MRELNSQEAVFSKSSVTLLKFHGMYQQDNRDLRKTGAKVHSFMVRVGIPGGRLSPAQYLELDRLADAVGDGTLRITSRQDIQYHYVGKHDLRTLIQALDRIRLTTLAACGDVVRNVTHCAAPLPDVRREQVWPYVLELSRALKPKTNAYAEIWIDGERAVSLEEEADELYGETYLPRKFKIGFAFAGDNTTDVYANDLGAVAHFDGAELAGFTILAGGGLGQSNGVKASHPRLADPVCFVRPAELVAAAKAIVAIHRDHGNRSNRKLARLKYVLEAWGLERFRAELAARLGTPLTPPRDLTWHRADDYLGWHRQSDTEWFYGLRVINGRLAGEQRRRVRELLAAHGYEVRLTVQQNLLLAGIRDPAAVERALQPAALPPVLHHSMACPALPTCGQALTEAERVLPEIAEALQAAWDRAGLGAEAVRVRVTGCPNGCARPYTAEIGIVGQSVDLYSIYAGGSPLGTRLATLLAHNVRRGEIAGRLEPLFAAYAAGRAPGESFGDWAARRGELFREVA